MNPKSIRNELLFYFLSVVALLIVTNGILIFYHETVVKEYNEISNSIFSQHSLIGSTADLINTYNAYRNAPNTANLHAYEAKRGTIFDTLAKLSDTAASTDVHGALVGVENTIKNLTDETDAGVKNIQAGNVEGTSSHFEQANRKFAYVQENTSDLILKQIEYSQKVQEKSQKIQRLILVLIIVLLGTLIIGAIAASTVGSRKITEPLTILARIARVVAGGNLDVSIDEKLLGSGNEVGSLSKSFDTMIKNLRENVNSLKHSNERLILTKHEVDDKNEVLARLNKLMVGREVKMVELKKRIKELEGKDYVETDEEEPIRGLGRDLA